MTILLLYNLGILDYSLNRIETGIQSNAWRARSGGYTALNLLTPVQKLFGAGFGNYITENRFGLDTYGDYVNYSSVAEFLFTMGYVGTGMMFVLLIKVFFQGQYHQRWLLVAMLFLSIGGCPLSGKYMPLYFSLAMCGGSVWKRQDYRENGSY